MQSFENSFFHMMKRSSVFISTLVALFFNLTTAIQRDYLSDQSQRPTHAVINGEVRGTGSLPIGDPNCHLFIDLHLSRDERPRSIAKTKIKLYNNSTTSSFSLQFKLKYPISQISPHNSYMLSAKIRNGQHRLIYIGDLPVPVTERKENQAKYLIINVVKTRKISSIFLQNYFN